MRYTGVLIAGILMVFGQNVSQAFESPESTKVTQEKKQAEDQKEGGEKEQESEKKSTDEKTPAPAEEAKEPVVEAKEARAALDAVKALTEDYQAKYDKFIELARTKAFRADYSKASSEGRSAAKAFLRKAGQPDTAAYMEQMEEVAAISMAFIASKGNGSKSITALNYLFENHADSPVMESVISRAEYGVSPEKARSRYEAAIAENPSETVKALATISLAEMLAEEEPEDTAEVEELFQTVVDKYASVESGGTTLGKRAEKALFAIKYLRIGAVAPDIAAEDIDGVEFKLSDYRGKVVLLDFWGNW